MRFSKLCLLLTLFLTCLSSEAQVNNVVLLQPIPVRAEDAGEVKLGVNTFGFFRNNEYFNKIADGYTLFGYHLQPKLIYHPSSFIRVEAGALLWKDFGSTGYQDIAPTFTIKLQRDRWALLFGTLEGNLNHGYIEPLYDFERIISYRLENGLQYKLSTNALKLDAWLDWRTMLYAGENDQEKINGGAALDLLLLERTGRYSGDSLRLNLPLQFTAQHKGGQIDVSPLPLTTIAHAAVGLDLEKMLGRGTVHRIYTKNYLVGFKDFSGEPQLPYQQGYGIYLNAGADTKYLDAMLSYWQGQGYSSELGGRLYQSASTTVKNPDYLQRERRLLLLRASRSFELMEHVNLLLRLEPVTDLDDPKVEFSSGFYLVFNTEFFLAKPRE